jgi:ubiquinone/menaquinone biosynthesis C-methylase UbiE
MSDEKRATARRFGAAADAYFESAVHRAGADRQTLAAWCREADRALDIATGAGHTAGALLEAGVDAVVAVDAAPEMVATTVDAYGPTGVVADAERLPFLADAFEAVTCRIAAHHFPDPQAFVAETARVLDAGGVLAFEDNVAPPEPALAAWLNDVEQLRDPSHVSLYTEAQWVEWFESAGFVVEETTGTAITLDFAAWVARTNVPETDRAALQSRFQDAPAGAHDRFDVTFDDAGTVTAWANPKTLIRARRT